MGRCAGRRTTHDDVRDDHDHAVAQYGAFGVPIIVCANGRTIFGPVVVPAPTGGPALKLWDLCTAYSEIDGLFELKTPKTSSDLRMIAEQFEPYLTPGSGRPSRIQHREEAQ